MKINQLSVEAALASLRTSSLGLTSEEAQRRLLEFGFNEVKALKRQPLVLRFLGEFTHFFALILWLAAVLAFVADFNERGKGMATLGFAIVGVILINATFSFWQEHRAERAIEALQRLLPADVKVVRGGMTHVVPARILVPGDLITLQEGDDIPADCRLIEAFGVRVDDAAVTGESVPRGKNARPVDNDDLLHSKNVLLAGTSVVSGDARAVVYATGMRTEFGKIARLTETAGHELSPLQIEIVRLSRLVAAVAVSLGGIFFLVGRSFGIPFWDNFIFAIGIIVANVPEGLLPTVTLAMAMGSQRMARKNVLIRHLPSVETLGSATVICTDKTGTLTENRMKVVRIYAGGSFHRAEDLSAGSALCRANRRLFEAALLCQNVRKVERRGLIQPMGDPTEVALVNMAERIIPEGLNFPRLDEVPFDSDRKRLSVLCDTPEGAVLYTKGALELLLPCCTQVRVGDEVRPLARALQDQFLEAQQSMADAGLRVLAFAFRQMPAPVAAERLEEEMTLLGLVALEDPPRPGVPAAINACRQAGIKVIMVTGDHPGTAIAVARAIGLATTDSPAVMLGDQLRRLSDAQLQLHLDAPELIFARIGADQKMRIVEALRRKREIVAVTGDGVNDAPALRAADIGIAMGLTGTDVAREAADMVLMEDNFVDIVRAIEEGRTVYENIRRFLTYILTSNVPEIVPYLAYMLYRIPLPLTIVQILAVDLGTDMVPALGLGAEEPDTRVMRKPPRPRHVRLLDGALLARAYLFLGMLEAAAAMAAFFFVLVQGGWHYGDSLAATSLLYRQATTACFSTIIVTQIVNVFLCRSDRESIVSRGLWGNRLILAGVAFEIVLVALIDYTPVGNAVLGTAPIPLSVWLFALPFAAAMLLLEEARKKAVRSIREPS